MTERTHLNLGTAPIANSDLARTISSVTRFDLPNLFRLMEAHRDLDKDLTRGFEQRMMEAAKGLIGGVLSVNGQPLELGKPLGAGTRGIVFAARRVGEESFDIALKVSQPYSSSDKATAERDSPRRCFEQEVRFLTLLQNEPNIRVPVLHGSCEIAQTGKKAGERIGLILMELVPGERMSQRLDSVVKDDHGAKELTLLCAGMLEGVDAVLSKGIWVDDAGINNTIVPTDKKSPIVIFDFGAARFERDLDSAHRDIAGFIGSQLEQKAMEALNRGGTGIPSQARRMLGNIKSVGTRLKDGDLTLKGGSEILKGS